MDWPNYVFAIIQGFILGHLIWFMVNTHREQKEFRARSGRLMALQDRFHSAMMERLAKTSEIAGLEQQQQIAKIQKGIREFDSREWGSPGHVDEWRELRDLILEFTQRHQCVVIMGDANVSK